MEDEEDQTEADLLKQSYRTSYEKEQNKNILNSYVEKPKIIIMKNKVVIAKIDPEVYQGIRI